MSDKMKLADEVKDAYKRLCKEAISNELVEDQGQFKEVFVRTMNGPDCQDLLAQHFDGNSNHAGFQKTVLNFVRTEFLTLLRVSTEKFRFYLNNIDHTTLAEKDDKTRRYPAAFGFAIVQKFDRDAGEWEDYCEAEVQAFREATDNIRLSAKEWYQGNFEIANKNNEVFLLRVHPQASRFDKVNAPNAWPGVKPWFKDNYDLNHIADAIDTPSSDGSDYKLMELTLISSWIRGSAKGQLGFMEFVDDSVSLDLAKERGTTLRAIVPQEMAATYARGSTFLVLGIVSIDPQYGAQLSIKAIEEILPIKRRSYKTSVSEVGEENDDEEIDASAWVASKVEDSDEEWEDDEEESDEEEELEVEESDEEDDEEESDEEEELVVEEVVEKDEDDEDWEDLDAEF